MIYNASNTDTYHLGLQPSTEKAYKTAKPNKQHLRIESFFGTSENAVKTQVWIAISVYVLVAIIKKRLKLEAILYNILQISSATIFERIPLNQLLTNYNSKK